MRNRDTQDREIADIAYRSLRSKRRLKNDNLLAITTWYGKQFLMGTTRSVKHFSKSDRFIDLLSIWRGWNLESSAKFALFVNENILSNGISQKRLTTLKHKYKSFLFFGAFFNEIFIKVVINHIVIFDQKFYRKLFLYEKLIRWTTLIWDEEHNAYLSSLSSPLPMQREYILKICKAFRKNTANQSIQNKFAII